jgi:hypothetical protein
MQLSSIGFRLISPQFYLNAKRSRSGIKTGRPDEKQANPSTTSVPQFGDIDRVWVRGLRQTSQADRCYGHRLLDLCNAPVSALRGAW